MGWIGGILMGLGLAVVVVGIGAVTIFCREFRRDLVALARDPDAPAGLAAEPARPRSTWNDDLLARHDG